ncbi:MAG: biotin--[acetyl-CoA-carboxylase] ligase [Prevotellaceae bacterium]|nr:biotin--[acetyl-CoA-carboxylase] ligase [Prevotellaceae bacterium]
MLFDILYYETLPSSNNEAIRLASSGAPEATVVVCSEQTAGRGQRSNRWESSPGENLTMSLILRPLGMAADELFILSKAFSIAVVKALNRFGIEASIKWPNDIYVETRKIAGILIEHSFWGANLAFSVIGLGLNVNQTAFPPMDLVPTSIAAETGQTGYDINEILSATLENFALLYKSDKTLIHCEYMAKLYRRKGYFHYKTKNGATLIAEIHDVADSGELILKDKNEKYYSFLFKEITFLYS